MENYKNILVDKKRFKIPEGYFDRFELNNINIKKENPRGFLVPDYYFESIDKQQIFNKIYKKGFEITFPFPFNSIMKFGKVLPYRLYFKFTEKKFSKK